MRHSYLPKVLLTWIFLFKIKVKLHLLFYLFIVLRINKFHKILPFGIDRKILSTLKIWINNVLLEKFSRKYFHNLFLFIRKICCYKIHHNFIFQYNFYINIKMETITIVIYMTKIKILKYGYWISDILKLTLDFITKLSCLAIFLHKIITIPEFNLSYLIEISKSKMITRIDNNR